MFDVFFSRPLYPVVVLHHKHSSIFLKNRQKRDLSRSEGHLFAYTFLTPHLCQSRRSDEDSIGFGKGKVKTCDCAQI